MFMLVDVPGGGMAAEWLRYGFTTRAQGPVAGAARVRQVHGAEVVRVDAGFAPVEADGMVTATAGMVLGVVVADCVPVLVADMRLRAAAALHAGWRGTVKGIVEVGIGRMREEFGSRPEDMMAWIGPSIGQCCYEVGEEVREGFGRFGYAEELFAGSHLDLWEANRRQLVGAGVAPERIAVVGECTACTWLDGERKYFSYRAEKGLTGRAMGWIGIAG